MTQRRLVGACGSVILALLMLLMTAGSGSAATRRFTDPNDSPGLDIHRVRVSYADWLRVRVRYDGPIRVGQTYGIWIDTRPRHPGPEYYFGFIPWSEVGNLQRVSGFGDTTKTNTKCQKVDGGVNEDQHIIGFAVAGTCLREPKRIRISVQFQRPNGTSADWAPAFRRFTPGPPLLIHLPR